MRSTSCCCTARSCPSTTCSPELYQASGHAQVPATDYPIELGHRESADKPHTIHSISEDTKEPQPTQKDTVMRNPPKRNMKTKSAVLPRKEPSSSMRQYLYLRAGEKGGVAV